MLLELHQITYHLNRVEAPVTNYLRDFVQDLKKYKVVQIIHV